MLIDITLKITPEIIDASPTDKELRGHLGTHFDVMNKEFPLEYTQRKGLAFDVSEIRGRDISSGDIDTEMISEGMFVAFYSGYTESVKYADSKYFKEHPQLSHELIEKLLCKGVSIIGVDFAGVRRGSEHTPTDQYCADRDTFVVENLCRLKFLCDKEFTVYTFPMNLCGTSGIPCRVIAEI